jgi:hypothetical protein
MDVNTAKQAAHYFINLNLETILFMVFIIISVLVPIYKWIFSNTKKRDIKAHCPPEMMKSLGNTDFSITAINEKIGNIQEMLRLAMLATSEISGSLKTLIAINRDDDKEKEV